jgi:pyruvyl transferase EpsO
MRSNPYQEANLRRGALHYLLGRGAAGLAGLVTVVLLVRCMDLRNYAVYTALSGLVSVCGVLAGMGMERILARYTPEGRLYHRAADLGRFIWTCSGVRLLAISLIALAVYLGWPLLDRWLAPSEAKLFTLALALFIIGETMFQHFTSVLQALAQQSLLTRLLTIQWGGRLLLIGAMMAAYGQIDWAQAFWCFAIPEVSGVLAFAWCIARLLRALAAEPHPVADGPWPQWDKMVGVGVHNFGYTLLAAPPQGYFMKVVTAAYLPLDIVAAYGFFVSVAEKARQYIPLHFFYGMLEPVLVAAYLKDRDFNTLSRHCALLYKSNLLMMVPAIVCVAVAGDPLVDVAAGGKFHGLSWILLLLLVQLTSGSHVLLLQLILNSVERSKILLQCSLVALPVMLAAMAVAAYTVPLALPFTPILFSLTMNFAIVRQLARHQYPYHILSWTMLAGIICCGGVAYVVVKGLMLASPYALSSLTTVVLAMLAVGVVYVLSLWGSRTIDAGEVQLIKSLFSNKRTTKAGI